MTLNWFWTDFYSALIRLLFFMTSPRPQHYMTSHYALHSQMWIHWVRARDALAWILDHGPSSNCICKL